MKLKQIIKKLILIAYLVFPMMIHANGNSVAITNFNNRTQSIWNQTELNVNPGSIFLNGAKTINPNKDGILTTNCDPNSPIACLISGSYKDSQSSANFTFSITVYDTPYSTPLITIQNDNTNVQVSQSPPPKCTSDKIFGNTCSIAININPTITPPFKKVDITFQGNFKDSDISSILQIMANDLNENALQTFTASVSATPFSYNLSNNNHTLTVTFIQRR